MPKTLWEQVSRECAFMTDSGEVLTHRMKVPGGWLVRSVYSEGGVALIFVDDSQGLWKPAEQT